jgi:hypothetical protein
MLSPTPISKNCHSIFVLKGKHGIISDLEKTQKEKTQDCILIIKICNNHISSQRSTKLMKRNLPYPLILLGFLFWDRTAYVAQTSFELTVYPWVSSKSQYSFFSLQSSGIIAMTYHSWLRSFLFPVVLGIKPRTLHMLGKHWAIPKAHQLFKSLKLLIFNVSTYHPNTE